MADGELLKLERSLSIIHPNDGMAYISTFLELAAAYRRAGRTADAIATYRTAMRTSPESYQRVLKETEARGLDIWIGQPLPDLQDIQ